MLGRGNEVRKEILAVLASAPAALLPDPGAFGFGCFNRCRRI